MTKKMDQGTSARHIHQTALDNNCQAFEDVLRLVLFPVASVLDVRYGFGSWARTVRARFPDALIRGYETDPWVTARAWYDSRVELATEAFDAAAHAGAYDLVCGDFNMVTRLDRGPVDEAAAMYPKALAVTDVACNKLHLNFAAYGLGAADLDAYWDGWTLPGYRLAGYSRRHGPASTGLFVREDIPCP